MDSAAFLQEILVPVREFCRTLDARPPAYSYIPLRTDEERIRVCKAGSAEGLTDTQDRVRRAVAMRMVLFREYLTSLDRWAMGKDRW